MSEIFSILLGMVIVGILVWFVAELIRDIIEMRGGAKIKDLSGT